MSEFNHHLVYFQPNPARKSPSDRALGSIVLSKGRVGDPDLFSKAFGLTLCLDTKTETSATSTDLSVELNDTGTGSTFVPQATEWCSESTMPLTAVDTKSLTDNGSEYDNSIIMPLYKNENHIFTPSTISEPSSTVFSDCQARSFTGFSSPGIQSPILFDKVEETPAAQDIDSSLDTKPITKRKRRGQNSKKSREQSLALNREAARKCRVKRNEKATFLQETVASLQASIASSTTQIVELTNELNAIRQAVHKNACCSHFYILATQMEAERSRLQAGDHHAQRLNGLNINMNISPNSTSTCGEWITENH